MAVGDDEYTKIQRMNGWDECVRVYASTIVVHETDIGQIGERLANCHHLDSVISDQQVYGT